MNDTKQMWEDLEEAFIRDAIVNGVSIFIAMHNGGDDGHGKMRFRLVHREEFQEFAEFLLEYPELYKERLKKNGNS